MDGWRCAVAGDVPPDMDGVDLRIGDAVLAAAIRPHQRAVAQAIGVDATRHAAAERIGEFGHQRPPGIRSRGSCGRRQPARVTRVTVSCRAAASAMPSRNEEGGSVERFARETERCGTTDLFWINVLWPH